MQLIYLEKIIHLRHTLHQHPDLSMRESGTIRFLQNFLRENTSLEIHEREGWFYALKKSSSPDKFRAGNKESGKPATTGSIAFRADLDALPADSHLVENLAACLEKENTGAAYARQLPRPDCQVIERITRSFNYPEKGAVHTAEDVPALGIKAYFCSNVCAMYRRDLYEALGGFCRRAIFNEDMLFAAALIGNGYAVEYCAQARVYHSHNYSLKQQFSRNFDLAVSQAEHPEVFEAVPSEGEGLRLVRYTSGKLLRSGKGLWIPYFFLQCAAKYAGYFLGKRWRRLPERVILKMTMNPGYWEKEFREQN